MMSRRVRRAGLRRYEHVTYHGGDAADLIVIQARIHRDLNRLRGPPGPSASAFAFANSSMSGGTSTCSVSMSIPRRTQRTTRSSRSIRSGRKAVLVVDVRAAGRDKRHLDARKVPERAVHIFGVGARLARPAVETLQRFEPDGGLHVRKSLRVLSGADAASGSSPRGTISERAGRDRHRGAETPRRLDREARAHAEHMNRALGGLPGVRCLDVPPQRTHAC